MLFSSCAYIDNSKWDFFLLFAAITSYFPLGLCGFLSLRFNRKKKKKQPQTYFNVCDECVLYMCVWWQECDLHLVFLEICCVGKVHIILWIMLFLCNAYKIFRECIAKHFLQAYFHLFFMSECLFSVKDLFNTIGISLNYLPSAHSYTWRFLSTEYGLCSQV